MMKLVHWIQISLAQGGVSGMMNSTRELIEAEMGVIGVHNVAVCDTATRAGGQPLKLVRRTANTLPWETAFKDPDVVHVIHTFCPYSLHEMKRKVFLSHGTPEYCWWDDILRISPNWWQITTLVRESDATVCWFERDAEFWRELTDGKVQAIRRGVDLGYWIPVEYQDPLVHPYILYAEALRLIKLPFALLFAVKKVQRILPLTYLKLVLSDPPTFVSWSNLVTRLNMEHFVPLGLGMIEDPRPMYCSADIGASPVMWGLISRAPAEMMACGVPVLCLKGPEDEPIHGVRVEDTPESMATGIMSLWDRIHGDREGERAKARKMAERHYDVRQTARDMVKVCEGVM